MWLRKFRRSKGLTQMEVAVRANVSNNTLSEIEQNKHKNPEKYLGQITEAITSLIQEREIEIDNSKPRKKSSFERPGQKPVPEKLGNNVKILKEMGISNSQIKQHLTTPRTNATKITIERIEFLVEDWLNNENKSLEFYEDHFNISYSRVKQLLVVINNNAEQLIMKLKNKELEKEPAPEPAPAPAPEPIVQNNMGELAGIEIEELKELLRYWKKSKEIKDSESVGNRVRKTFHIPEEYKLKINEYSKRYKISKSDILERALFEFFENEKQEKLEI